MKRLIAILILCISGLFLLAAPSAESAAAEPVPVKVFKANPANVRLNVGETAQAEYIIEPEDATDKSLAVAPGSLAEKAGLQVWDLVAAVDGISWNDDNYFIEKGKTAMAEGRSIVVTVERPGQEGTLDLIFSK